ncbi:MAG: hypothetical protein ABMA01_10225, partial [Chthoniobacteraceae bacterium]
KVGLVVRNRSDSDVKFSYTFRLDNRLSVVVVDEAGKEHPAAVAHFDGLLTYQQMLLPAGHVATIAEFTLRFDPEKRVVSEPHVSAFHLPPGKYKLRCKWNDALPEVAHEGEWTGELVNEELEFTLAAAPAPAAETPKGADAGQRRKLDWSKFPYYETPQIPFANPFVPEDALRLAAVPTKSKEDIKRLVDMIHQAAVEKAVELRPLLADEKLKASDDKNGSIGFALAAYDYSVNGNKAALQQLLDGMALDDNRKAETAAWSLNYVDEWDLTMAAWLKHFGRFSTAEEHDLFWNVREFLYPENYAAFVAKRLAEAKLDAASLRGVWQGAKDGVIGVLRFGDKAEWEIAKGETVSKDVLSIHTDFTTPKVSLYPPPESKGWIRDGTLDIGDAGALRLRMTTSSGEQIELSITKQAEKPKGAAAAKLTPDALLGFWRGKMDGKDLTLSFHRPPVEKDVQLDIYTGEATIGSLAMFTIAAAGGSALIGSGRPDSAAFGTLHPIDANTMRLESADKEGKAVSFVVLTRDVEEPATEPRQ